MSIGMVTKTRDQLAALGYIRVKHREDDTCVIVIVDRWAENIARYAHEAAADEADEFDAPSGVKRSSGEQGVHTVREGVHHMNTPKHEGVHHMNERIQQPREVEPKKNKKTLASVDASRFQNPDGSSKWPDASGDVSSLRLEGKQQISARAQKAKSKPQQPTTPPPGSAQPSPKEKSILHLLIDDRWSNSRGKITDPQGHSRRLIPALMGTSKTPEYRVLPAASEDEIMAFSIWYREAHPNTSLPMESKLASWFGQFRACGDYAPRLKDAAYYVSKIYHSTPQASEPVKEVDPVADPELDEAYTMMNELIRRAEAGL